MKLIQTYENVHFHECDASLFWFRSSVYYVGYDLGKYQPLKDGHWTRKNFEDYTDSKRFSQAWTKRTRK